MEFSAAKTVIFTVFIVMLLGFSVILLVYFFNRRKNRLIVEKEELKHELERELITSQIEIREEILRNISWELHDNIGQLLTLAKIQLQNSNGDNTKINDSTEILGKALEEVRALSKSINPEGLKELNLKEAIKLEIDRLNRMKYISAKMKIKGSPFEIDTQAEVILFRMIQEFFSNTLKHSKATELTVEMAYHLNELSVIATDNGIGFNTEQRIGGIGLKNMQKRAELIGAILQLNSVKDRGTVLSVNYKK